MSLPEPVVALGGGHGLYASLSALRTLTHRLTAVVTVADDGGSSGRLRAELGMAPPGDLRMALSALCENTEWGHTWRDTLQSRFDTDGPLDGHAVGNLLIAALWNRSGSMVESLDWVAQLLRARGRVLPQAEDALEISATVTDALGARRIVGQSSLAVARGDVSELRIEPAAPRVPEETIAAIADAGMVVLGPGSWYTSVLTHFLVAPVADALVAQGPRSVLVANVGDADIETAGMGRAAELRAMRDLAPDFAPAVVIVDADYESDEVHEVLDSWGSHAVFAQVQDPSGRAHRASALASAFETAGELLALES